VDFGFAPEHALSLGVDPFYPFLIDSIRSGKGLGVGYTVSTLPANFVLLQVVPDLDAGGAEQSTLDIVRAVVRSGGRALVASRGGRMVKRLDAEGGVFVPLPVHTKNPIRMFKNALALAKVVRQRKVSLIHVRSRAPAFSALWASRMTGVPMVATYHGAYPAKTALKRWYNGVMTRGALTIANSDFTRGHLLGQHKVDVTKVVTIPRGVDFKRFDPAAVTSKRLEAMRVWLGINPKDKRLKVLLPGRLTRLKGQLVLIEAAARLRAEGHDDILILMVGDDQGRTEYRAELLLAVARWGLEGRVRILGHCDDMPAALMAVDVIAAPSTVPETFGRTAVEPQAMGKPVIASALGGLIETVLPGETGWLVPPGDSRAWAEALQEAVDLGKRGRNAMGARGQKRVRARYSVEAMGTATLAAYATVLGARR
jgi:glycosyltransferase involved in cell wall biosynthesis